VNIKPPSEFDSASVTDCYSSIEQLTKISRKFEILSAVNSAMLHASSEQQWLQDACESIIDKSEYKMAWVGFVQRKGAKNITPVVSAGFEDDYLAGIQESWGDDQYGRGPAGQAVKENKICVLQDLETDADFEPWREQSAKRGYQSICAAPICIDEDMSAVLLVYASTKNAFSMADISFLQQLADDVGFGIRTIRQGDAGKKALKNLSTEKQRLERIVKGIDAGIVLLDANVKITWANESYQQWFGDMDVLLGKHRCEILNIDDPVRECVATAATLSGHLEKRSMSFILQTGEEKYFDLVASPLFDTKGELVQIVETVVDVSDKVFLQKKRDSAERSLNRAQKIAHIGSWELDIQSNDLLWSDEIFNIFEIDPEKFTVSYTAFLDAIHPDDRARVDEAYANSLKNKKSYEIVHRLKMKDGRIKYVHERCETNFNDQGEPLKSLGTIQDITETIQVEQELMSSEDHYRQLVESTTAIPWELDLQTFCFTYVGPQAEKILGYEAEDWYEEKFWPEHIHPDDREYAVKFCFDSTNKGEDHVFEYRMLAKDGRSIWIRDDVKVVKENNKAVRLQGFMFDVTERRQAEEIMRRSQKMDAVEKLTGGIAHDFNNQLGVVRGYLEFLEDFTKDQDKPHRWVDMARKATDRCIDLSRKLLDFSRRQQMKTEQLNINSVLEKMHEIIGHSISHRIKVNYDLADDVWPVLVNPGELEDALINLIINARDAMQAGGDITISTINQLVEKDHSMQLNGLKQGEYVQINIADTGCGISDSVKERIFEPFFSTKEEGKGTGLGLSMIYSFVQRSSGLITVYSEPDEGSSFHVYLPRFVDVLSTVDEADKEVEEHQTETKSTGRGETILVVEDEPQLRELADHFLKMLNYNTVLAVNADDAIDVLKTDIDIDLLFSDIIMPGEINGYGLAEQAVLLKPKMKILLTSGFTGSESKQNDYRGELLQKPYSKQGLADAINKLMPENRESSDKPVLDENISLIKWENELTVNNEEMDGDHRKLMVVLNDYRQSVVDNEGNEVFDKQLQMLVDLSNYHFAREELLMESCGYPHYVNHKQVHVMLLKTVTDMLNIFRKAPDIFDHLSTIGFLEHWFKAHIQDMDVEYASYLKDHEDCVASVLEKMKPLEGIGAMQLLQPMLTVVDDQKSMGEFVCDIAVSAGYETVHYMHAREFIENHNKKSAVIVLDLLMPDLDGVEMIRLLAGMQSEAALILISGVDKSVLHSAQELAIEHGLNLAGTLQKPFHAFELKRILGGVFEQLKEAKPVSIVDDKVLIGEQDLVKAIESKEFIAYYQPQVSMKDNTVIGFEVLMRWKHPQRGLILPYQFIGLAEVSGFIDEMTWLLMDQVAKDCKEKQIKQTISVNMTAGIFKQLDLPDRLHAIGERYGHWDNSQLTLEVTESALMEELTKSLDSLTRLRLKGFKLSIDDFGTGYSSMIQLYRAPFTELKVDQSFVMRMENDDEARAIVESTIALGQNLNMKIVAEGVETDTIYRSLKEMNCDIAQGYYIARPMPIEDVLPWLEEWESKHQ
jgi:hemerythrin-like metal-binding protein/PAS domain S-box-containing protein